MDIAKMATALSQAQVKQQASLSVMKLVLDQGKGQASDMIDLVDSSSAPSPTHPHLGGKIDIQA